MVKLLNYAAKHPAEITRYHTIGIILHMHSSTHFLSALGAKRRAGGYHYLSTPSTPPPPPTHPHTHTHITPPLNGPIHMECTKMKNFLKNAMKSELG